MKKDIVKAKVIRGFALPGQGYYHEGTEVTFYFEQNQKVGVLTPQRYEALLRRGSIEPIEKTKEA